MRPHTARTPFHAVRSAMLATATVTLAAGAHVLAGGQLPVPGILLAILALTCLSTTAVTRLRLNMAAMAGLLGAGQFVLHELFTALGSAFGPAGSAGSGVQAHHQHAFTVPLQAEQLQPHDLDSPMALAMLTGHTVATIACALLLAKGENALWSLAAWLRPLVQLPTPVTPDAVVAPAVPGWPADAAPLPWRNLRRDCRRGPPLAVVVYS